MLMKRWVVCGLLLGGAAWAQPAAPTLVHPDELWPTRMVLCQREVRTLDGDRARRLRTCLSRRLEGEGVIERRCRGQVRGVSGQAARAQAQRDCERQALAVPSTELPRRPPPPPRPPPEAAVVSSPPPPMMPAAGEN